MTEITSSSVFDRLCREEYFSPFDRQFAISISDRDTSLDNATRETVRLALGLASRTASLGDVCVDLKQICGTRPLRKDGHPCDTVLPDQATMVSALVDSAVCRETDDGATPLVLDRHFLYLHRLWTHQGILAKHLLARCPVTIAASEGAALLNRSVQVLEKNRLLIITGGPGTGKTTLVSGLIAQLLHRSADMRVRLVAPTGKAAMRLQSSIREAQRNAQVPSHISDGVQTVHAALGIHPVRPSCCRYHRQHPLPVDLLVVDEASMIDLVLMSRLFDAMPSEGAIVLLGDKDQLMSIDAGAVFGDICFGATATTGAQGLRSSIISLTHNYRFDAAGGIGQLAQAVNRGDVARAMEVLRDPRCPDVEWIDSPCGSEGIYSREFYRIAQDGFSPLASAASPIDATACLDRFRILSPLRQGPCGCEQLNREVERALIDGGYLDDLGDWYPGRPVMALQNDYQTGILNGDMGIVHRNDTGDIRVVFSPFVTHPKTLSPAMMPPHETAYVTTVHKSQGSEFDMVVLVMGDRISPVFSREMLYTAVTRARQRLVIMGSAGVIEHCIHSPSTRRSGLRDLLWETSY